MSRCRGVAVSRCRRDEPRALSVSRAWFSPQSRALRAPADAGAREEGAPAPVPREPTALGGVGVFHVVSSARRRHCRGYRGFSGWCRGALGRVAFHGLQVSGGRNAFAMLARAAPRKRGVGRRRHVRDVGGGRRNAHSLAGFARRASRHWGPRRMRLVTLGAIREYGHHGTPPRMRRYPARCLPAGGTSRWTTRRHRLGRSAHEGPALRRLPRARRHPPVRGAHGTAGRSAHDSLRASEARHAVYVARLRGTTSSEPTKPRYPRGCLRRVEEPDSLEGDENRRWRPDRPR